MGSTESTEGWCVIDIGSLTGQITLEDQLSDKLTDIANHVRKFADDLEGAMGAVAVSVGVATAAIIGMTISVVALGEKGSTILGVENAFDHLAESIGSTGKALSGSLSAGVRQTVDDFDLMRSTSKLLGSGMKLTEDQARLMGEAARELGKATGGDAASGLDIMSSALVTGRVRGLQQQIGLIDLAAGEKKFAESIGVTVDQLSEAGKLEGKRIAILDATKVYVDRLGVSELSFKERLKQGEVAIEEWGDTLAKSVASSADVNNALKAISEALGKAFGSAQQSLMDAILAGINGFARALTAVVPYVVSFGSGIMSLLKTLYDYRILIESAAGALAAYYAAVALGTTLTATYSASLVTAALAQGEFTMALGFAKIAALEFGASVKALWVVIAANPVVATVAAIAALTAVMTQWYTSSKDAELAAETLAAKQFTINKAIHDGAPAVITYADAIAYNAETFRKAHGGALELSKALDDLRGNSGNTQTQLVELNTSVMDLANKGQLTTPLVNRVASAIAAMKIPVDQLPPALQAIAISAANAARSAGDEFVNSSKKIEEATAAGLARAEELWDSYYAAVEKGAGDNEAAQLAAADRMFTSKMRSIEKTKKLDLDYQDEVNAATALHEQQRTNIIQAALLRNYKLAEDADQKRLDEAYQNSLEIADARKKSEDASNAAYASAQDQLVALTVHGMDAQLLAIQKGAEKQIQALGQPPLGAEQAWQNAVDEIHQLSKKQVENLYIDNQAISENSISTLQTTADKAATTYDYMVAHSDEFSRATIQHFKDIAEEAQRTADGTKSFADSLSGLSQAFSEMAQVGGDAFGGVAKAIGQVVTAMNVAQKSGGMLSGLLGKGFAGGIFDSADQSESGEAGMFAGPESKKGKAAFGAVQAGVGMLAQATANSRTAAGVAVNYAAQGAQLGAMAGPWGMAIGAAAGLVAGIIKGKPEWAKVAEEVGRDFGVKISDELAKDIEKIEEESHVGRVVAELMDMNKIIAEAGGLSAANLDKFTGKLHDVFSGVQTGAMTAAQATKVLDDNWKAFAEAGTAADGRLSDSLKEIVKLQGQFGVQSKEISQWLQGQGSDAIKGFSAVAIGATKSIIDGFEDAKKKGEEFRAGTEKDKASLDALGVQAIASYAAAVASGMSSKDALAQEADALDALRQSYADLGLSVDDVALKNLLMQENLLKAAPELVNAVSGLTQEMIALDNMGVMNASTLAALETSGANAYEQIKQKVIELGGTDTDALTQMQSYLHEVAKEAENLGVPIDANTQALIDQSKAAGVWQESLTPQDKLLKGMESLVDSVTDLVNQLRGIPPKINTTITTTHVDQYEQMQMPNVYGGGFLPGDQYDPAFYAAMGGRVTSSGVVYYGGGGSVLAPQFQPQGTDTVPAMLTPGETVESAADTKSTAASLKAIEQAQADTADALDGIRRILADQARAIAVAVNDAVVLAPRKAA